MRIVNLRSWARGRRSIGLMGLFAAISPLLAGCQLEIPDGWFPDIPSLPDSGLDSWPDDGETLPTTSADEPGEGEVTGTTSAADPPGGSSGGSADTGDVPADTTGAVEDESTGDVSTGAASTGGLDSGDASTGDLGGEATTGPGEPTGVCGDAVVDPGEVCDDGVNDGAYGGCQMCVAPGPFCGDGKLDGPEECDAGAEASLDCTTLCTRPTCGDGIVQANEQCDGAVPVGAAGCESLGFTGGALGCLADRCMYDLSHCFGCGNGVVEGDELCDAGTTTSTPACDPSGETSVCNATCDGFVAAPCEPCGNGVLESGELCDGAALGDHSCASFGFTGGELGCSRTCDRFDTAGCTGEPGGACCQPGPAGACDVLTVQACVCLANSDCCALAWSAECVDLAVLACGADCT